MSVMLSITSPELSAEGLHNLALDLNRTIEHETDVDAKLMSGSHQVGTKGEPITISVITLAIIKSGAAIALINILKSYLIRDSSLEMQFKRDDGTELKFTFKNFTPNQIESTMKQAREFFEE